MIVMITLAALIVSTVAENAVYFYEDRGGGGSACVEEEPVPWWTEDQTCILALGDDEIASVKVCGHFCVELYGDGDPEWQSGKFYGRMCNYWPERSDDGCSSMDLGEGKVSSYWVFLTNKTSDWSYVIFYENKIEDWDEGTGGTKCIQSMVGQFDRGDRLNGCMSSLGNDEIQSIQICGLRKVKLYNEPGCIGGYDMKENRNFECHEPWNIGDGAVSCFEVEITTLEVESNPDDIVLLTGEWVSIGGNIGTDTLQYSEGMYVSGTLTTSVSNAISVTVEVHKKIGATWEVVTGLSYGVSITNTYSNTVQTRAETVYTATCREEYSQDYIAFWQWRISSVTFAGGDGPVARTNYFLCLLTGDEPQCIPGNCETPDCQFCTSETTHWSRRHIEGVTDSEIVEVCALEGSNCNCENGYVSYGKERHWMTKHTIGDQSCDSTNFNLPWNWESYFYAPWLFDFCLCTNGHRCASEGGRCNCDNGYISYGQGTTWITHDQAGDQYCNDEVFGWDQDDGYKKDCYCFPNHPNPLVFCCAFDGEPCICSGTVWYGAGNSWTSKPAIGPIPILCSIDTFGDPIPNVDKFCLCQSE